MNILIVEDEIVSSCYLIDILESLGYKNTYDCTNTQDAVNIIKENKIDLVFMDINIKGNTDGIECAKILNKEYTLPIIFTTAYTDSSTVLEASETNIYGYLIKPFEKADVKISLMLAIKKIQNNKPEIIQKSNTIIDLGNEQKYNLTNKTFTINNKTVDLTKKELDLLNIFCKNINHNISYDTLKDKVWENPNISNSTIRDTISRLKRKTPNLNIKNIMNFGYVLKN